MKKVIAGAILLGILAVVSVPAYALTSQEQIQEAGTVERDVKTSFKDMNGSEWYYADVMNLVKRGAIGGYPDGSFGPSKTITFAEFLAISLKSVEKDIQDSPTDSHWAMGVYNTAFEKGIIAHDEFGKSASDLNAPISREDMALIVMRLNQLIQKETKADTVTTQAKIPDFIQISKDRQDYVLQAYQKGLISGKGNGFDPKGKTTRAEASIVVLRLIDTSKRGNLEDIEVGGVDVYGRKIRTTNLPSNASMFPYIAEGIPNWAYEQQPWDDNYWGPSVNTLAPKGASKSGYLPKHVYGPEGVQLDNVIGDNWEELNEFMETYLNIDYRTFNKKKYTDVMTAMTDIRTTTFKSEKELRAHYDSFADAYIRSKFIMRSESKILPETAWITVNDQVGVMNFSVYTKILPVQVDKGSAFAVPGSIQFYDTVPIVKASSIKPNQELEGIVTYTLLKNSRGEWKLHVGSMNAFSHLNPKTDTLNGVAPSKKDTNRVKDFNYTWGKDKKVRHTRYDRSVTSSFSLD